MKQNIINSSPTFETVIPMCTVMYLHTSTARILLTISDEGFDIWPVSSLISSRWSEWHRNQWTTNPIYYFPCSPPKSTMVSFWLLVTTQSVAPEGVYARVRFTISGTGTRGSCQNWCSIQHSSSTVPVPELLKLPTAVWVDVAVRTVSALRPNCFIQFWPNRSSQQLYCP